MAVSINVLESYLNDVDKVSNAYVERDLVFKWVEPREVISAEDSIKGIREQESSHKLNIRELDILVNYYEECISQRESFCITKGQDDYISPLTHLTSMLCLTVEHGLELNYASFRRELMNEADFKTALIHIEKAINRLTDKNAKNNLIEFANFFYCHLYVSPEIETLPELQKFRSSEENIKRLNGLAKLAEF